MRRGWFGGVSVFVDEAVAAVGSQDSKVRAGYLVGVIGSRGLLVEGAVWPMAVVVGDVVDDEAFELTVVPDDGAVEQLTSQGADPSFSESVRCRCSDGGAEDPEAFGAEDLEAVDELAAPIPDQRPGSPETFIVPNEEVPCRLGGPWSGRVVGGHLDDQARGSSRRSVAGHVDGSSGPIEPRAVTSR